MNIFLIFTSENLYIYKKLIVNKYIDHTLLKPDAREQQIIELCQEATDYNFASVCVHPQFVGLAYEKLKHEKLKVCTVIGFPLGQNTTEVKIFEAQNALKNGADEIDMVINVSWLKDGLHELLLNEIASIKQTIGHHILKVIVEICLLTDEEIISISEVVSKSGADFIKTSTGFGTHGATMQAVEIMKAHISEKVQIKASGGIRDFETAKSYIDLGVTRLGTSSGVEIVEGIKSDKTY